MNPKLQLSPEGIRFNFPDGVPKEEYSKEMLHALRRVPVNTGHPINSDLARCVRLGGGSVRAVQACRRMVCDTCERLKKPKLPRPTSLAKADLRFSDEIQMELFELKDAKA